MENKDFDDLDKILYKEFNQNFKVTSKVSKRIDDTINMIRHKQKFSYKVIDSLKKVAVVSVSAVTLFGGYCFAKMIIENYFYTENNGIETAASNGYIYTINSDYSVSNNNKLKVDNIKCQALILCGEKDNVNIESAKQLNRNIEESKLEKIKNAGHEVNTENPKELASVISEYWK